MGGKKQNRERKRMEGRDRVERKNRNKCSEAE
jgi:hypothetical protein